MPKTEIHLIDSDGFEKYRLHVVKEWATRHVKAGTMDKEGSLKKSLHYFDQMTPMKQFTPGNYMWVIRIPVLQNGILRKEDIGFIWIELRYSPYGVFANIIDLEIYERYRKKGHATKSVELAIKFIKKADPRVDKITLQVHQFNSEAILLYTKLGFTVSSHSMFKKI